ncbi:MarC family protein [Gluconobacter roseus]|uniref:MarC family protein n=1 Tax=Gluconobacter roseus TaxID=586239 RepID=UPI0038D24D45
MSLAPGLGNTLSSWLIAFPALFSIINPLGASLIFAQATEGRDRREVVELARQVALNSLGIMLVSIWFGSWILGFFGISINALRITGGLVVASRAWLMLLQPETSEARKEKQALQGGRTVTTPDLRETAFFPLAMPFTVGPGSIPVAIALSSSTPPNMPTADYYAGVSAAATTMAVVVAVVYAYAERVVAMLGVTGTRIVSRLAALILLAIGVQIMASGAEGFLVEALKQAKAA